MELLRIWCFDSILVPHPKTNGGPHIWPLYKLSESTPAKDDICLQFPNACVRNVWVWTGRYPNFLKQFFWGTLSHHITLFGGLNISAAFILKRITGSARRLRPSPWRPLPVIRVRQCWRQEEGLRWRSRATQAGHRRTWGRKGSTTAAPAASWTGASSSTAPPIEVRCAPRPSCSHFVLVWLSPGSAVGSERWRSCVPLQICRKVALLLPVIGFFSLFNIQSSFSDDEWIRSQAADV